MKGYCAKSDIENYLLQTIDSSFDAQVNKWISQIEAYIDRYCNRNFIAETGIKKYDGNGKKSILVDDFVTVTRLTIDDTDIDDYYIYPANSERKYEIYLVNDIFSRGHQNIEIEAKWGYSATVPDDIRLAATILVAGIILFSNNLSQQKRSESLGDYTVSYKDDRGWQDFDRAKNILDSYRKITF